MGQPASPGTPTVCHHEMSIMSLPIHIDLVKANRVFSWNPPAPPSHNHQAQQNRQRTFFHDPGVSINSGNHAPIAKTPTDVLHSNPLMLTSVIILIPNVFGLPFGSFFVCPQENVSGNDNDLFPLIKTRSLPRSPNLAFFNPLPSLSFSTL